jgi:DNA-binding NtrC family response regulator
MNTSRGRILIVDDDPDIREVLEDRLTAQGFEATVAANGLEGLQAIRAETPDLVILDLQMPEMDGMTVLQRMAEERIDTTVVVVTAYATVERAVAAMKAGAFDFLTKPFDPERLRVVVEKAVERERLRREHAWFRERAVDTLPLIAGESAGMRDLLAVARKAAESTATMLLLGESGTGKEVLARAIHQWSPRRDRPFVAVNCMALAESLLESELFGHEKGAFTGAYRQEKGKFEIARGGTILLDEIGATRPDLQLKLLRVLQEGAFERVGGHHVIRADVRVIAATNRNLAQAIRAGAFLEDLYYRLNVVSITLPPLRERPEDIPALAAFFLQKYARETKREVLGIAEEALAALRAYPWPGNIRELENAIERAVVLGTGTKIGLADLPEQVVRATAFPELPGPAERSRLQAMIRQKGEDRTYPIDESTDELLIRAALAYVKGDKDRAIALLGQILPASVPAPQQTGAERPAPPSPSGQSQERAYLLHALEAARWNRRQAAKDLGIPYSTLRHKMQRLGIS